MLLGATLGVAYLTHLQQHSLRYEAIADQLRRHPPAFLKVNTAQPPLMQALDVLSELRSHGARSLSASRSASRSAWSEKRSYYQSPEEQTAHK